MGPQGRVEYRTQLYQRWVLRHLEGKRGVSRLVQSILKGLPAEICDRRYVGEK